MKTLRKISASEVRRMRRETGASLAACTRTLRLDNIETTIDESIEMSDEVKEILSELVKVIR